MSDDSTPFLTVAELATRWNIHANTVRRRVESGSIPSVRLPAPDGRSRRIPREWVERVERGEESRS